MRASISWTRSASQLAIARATSRSYWGMDDTRPRTFTPTMNQRVLWRDRLPPVGVLIAGALLLAGMAVYVFAFSRHPGFLSLNAAVCREGYRRAHSAQDSALVDEQRPADGAGRGSIGYPVSCLVLRKSGEIH